MSAAEKFAPLVELVEDMVRRAVRTELDNRREPSDVMTTELAAELLHLEPKTVAKYAAAGKLPAHPLGPEWRFLRSELLAWLQEQKR